MTKLSDVQARLLAFINEGNEISITTWGGECLASNLPFGNVKTIRKLDDLGLVKSRRTSSFNTVFSKA